MFKPIHESDSIHEGSTLKEEDETAQTLSFEITQDKTSLSPTQSSANEDLLSSSAPVFIPDKTDNNFNSGAISPNQSENEYDESNPFGAFVMSQSLRVTDEVTHPRQVQRAISTGPRMEHPEDDASTCYPSVEDPFFPFLNPDLGSDMNNSENQLRNSNPTTMNGRAHETQSATDVLQKKRWQIVKGLSEANISPQWSGQEPANNSMTVLSSSAVQPDQKLQGKQRFSASVKLSKAGRKRLWRKSSMSSNLSLVGNYIFGSNIFQSPARSSTSMASDRINYIADPAGMYPSLMSLNSFDVAVDDDSGLRETSKPRSVSAYNSRQNSGNDLQGLDKKLSFMRSNSATSRGSSSSLSTRIFRDNDDKTLKDDEEADKLTEVKSVIARTQPAKKQWQQTMPDLEEGPESDTLTAQSTIRNDLAAAALAISVREKLAMDKKEAEEPIKEITPRIYTKNLLILCFAYFSSFTSYMSLRNLQSSLNDAGGLGMISLSCVYASIFFGSIFTTTIVQRLRPKLSIIISFLGLLLYNIANYYPSYGTLVPGSIIAGFSMALTWTAQGTYLANNALSSSLISGKRFPEVLSFYQGIFFASYQMAQVIGGLISSFLFSLHMKSTPITSSINATLNSTPINSFLNHTISTSNIHTCGMQYCPGSKSSKLSINIDPKLYFVMISIFLCSVVLAVLILAFCLNPLEGAIKKNTTKVGRQLSSVFRISTNPSMLCLVPLMSYSLLQTTFMFGEFNKAHVTCFLGIHMIGYMTVLFSLFSSFLAFLSGSLQRYLGTEVIIIAGLLTHLSTMTSFWVWTPRKESVVPFFVVVSFWGVGDGMLMAQIVSLLGTLFMAQKEAAFSSYKMIQSSSAFLMFITGAYICTRVKVIILTVMAILGILGCVVLKMRMRMESSKGVLTKSAVTVVEVSSK